MSSQRVRYIKQFFPIDSYTNDSINGEIDVVANNHHLFSGATVYLTSDKDYTNFKGVANVTSSNTFSVGCYLNQNTLTHYCVDGYLETQTGDKAAHSLPRAVGVDAIVQGYTTGVNGATLRVDVSLDDTHWIYANTLVLTSNSTGFIKIPAGWAYMRPNVVSIGANTNLTVMTGDW